MIIDAKNLILFVNWLLYDEVGKSKLLQQNMITKFLFVILFECCILFEVEKYLSPSLGDET